MFDATMGTLVHDEEPLTPLTILINTGKVCERRKRNILLFMCCPAMYYDVFHWINVYTLEVQWQILIAECMETFQNLPANFCILSSMYLYPHFLYERLDNLCHFSAAGARLHSLHWVWWRRRREKETFNENWFHDGGSRWVKYSILKNAEWLNSRLQELSWMKPEL